MPAATRRSARPFPRDSYRQLRHNPSGLLRRLRQRREMAPRPPLNARPCTLRSRCSPRPQIGSPARRRRPLRARSSPRSDRSMHQTMQSLRTSSRRSISNFYRNSSAASAPRASRTTTARGATRADAVSSSSSCRISTTTRWAPTRLEQVPSQGQNPARGSARREVQGPRHPHGRSRREQAADHH